jgi:methylenetetrahydrofolate--tRNA-(uracil-5-)-methyltransferase
MLQLLCRGILNPDGRIALRKWRINLEELIIIGGGLAGSEAAWQAANAGIKVKLFEMRPKVSTGAHETDQLAELICSNSLGSNQPDRAAGILKEEMRLLGSFIVACAEETALPAGGALAVDREKFAALVTARISANPNIEIIREEVTEIPAGSVIVASGPLTSPALASSIEQIAGQDHLFFFDAIAPIVNAETIDPTIAFRASRYEFENAAEDGGDYLNCPMNEEEYNRFVSELVKAERIHLESFEGLPDKEKKAGHKLFFEGCLPVEVIASRNPLSLSFGPLRPVGLRDPRTNRRPYAVVQLRQDNLAKTLYNLVGFQTNLTFPEQKRVFRSIPGLENAEFVRYGQMHRNTFIYSPALLDETLQFHTRPDLFFAGQIVGVEGYMGNVATGLVAGINAARRINGQKLIEFPLQSVTGALLHYISHASPADFQPMKANFGILPPLLFRPPGRVDRGRAYSKRALESIQELKTALS